MYCAIITKKTAKGEERSQKFNFVGKITEEVQKQWQAIEKHSNYSIELIPYTNERKKENE